MGGGSHGSLHRDDSEGVLLLCGMDVPEREQWSLTDVTPLVLDHFRVPLESMSDDGEATAARRPHAMHVRVRAGHGQGVQLASAGQVLRGRGVGLRRQPGRFRALRRGLRRSITWWPPRAAFVVAVVNNFWWNRHWTFAARGGRAGFQAARFFAVSVVAFVVAPTILELLVTVRGHDRASGAGNLDRGIHAPELRREQDLELRHRGVAGLRAALRAALCVAARRGRPGARGRAAPAGIPDRAAALLRAQRRAGHRRSPSAATRSWPRSAAAAAWTRPPTSRAPGAGR